MERILKADVG